MNNINIIYSTLDAIYTSTNPIYYCYDLFKNLNKCQKISDNLHFKLAHHYISKYLCNMRIDIITVLPELLVSPFSASIMKRAQDKGLVEIKVHDLREFGKGRYRHIDDSPYGGTSGMVIMCEPLDKMISKLKEERTYDEIIYLTPDGETLNQNMANDLSLKGNLMMICGHYKGIDQRIRDMHVTREISIGDYVLSGGEFGAIILADAIIRLLPGVIGNETSALSDSFQDDLLAPPIYTRPAEYKGHKVPDILLSGNFPKIEEWLHEQALERTKERRPDLLEKHTK